ncbi:TPA: hypothetical protein QH084_003126 [Morganella morganii subsp. morganii]|nr:hypothetical protein [Morganella morganii subsp. morganii]
MFHIVSAVAAFTGKPHTAQPAVIYRVDGLHQLIAVFEWLPSDEHIELSDR